MNINGFKIKNQKIQKIWLAVIFALVVAILLIIISFSLIFKKSSNTGLDKEDLFNYSSYYAKYNVVTYSNKNQNAYIVEEYCIRDSDDYKFRFNTMNKDNNYSYIVTKDSFYIKSDNQKSVFQGYNNLNSNTNILSIATFIDIYKKIDNMINEKKINENHGIKIELEQRDKKVCYNISFDGEINNESEMALYKETLINGMKISKIELIFDVNIQNPVEYIVYLDNGNAYIDITYDEFKINAKFDEKVFSF